MATKTEQIEFVKKIYPAAKNLYKNKGGIHPLFVTAQAALETGWQIKGISNNIFGITKGTTWTGKTELCLTTEYFSTPNKSFQEPERIVQVLPVPSNGRYRYRVYRLFRVYDSLEYCLDDHLSLLKKPMYADAWPYRNDPQEYAKRIVDDTGAKYATDPNYATIMSDVIDRVDGYVKELGI